MEISNDYWDFVEAIIATPVTILKEQADFLTKNTKGILVGEISFEGDFLYNTPIIYSINKMPGSAALNIKVPVLGYTYQLLSIHYNIKESYPVYIVFDNQLIITESDKTSVRKICKFSGLSKSCFYYSKLVEVIKSKGRPKPAYTVNRNGLDQWP